MEVEVKVLDMTTAGRPPMAKSTVKFDDFSPRRKTEVNQNSRGMEALQSTLDWTMGIRRRSFLALCRLFQSLMRNIAEKD